MHSVDEMCRAGCTTRRGVRHWESQGLLGTVARSEGDTRRYTSDQLSRARIIAAAQFGGWSLEEIAKMLAEYDQDMTVFDAITQRLSDQMRAAARLAESLPVPAKARKTLQEFDL